MRFTNHGVECLVGHRAEIRAAEPRKQKHDRRDADLRLSLLVEERFPAIWLPTKEQLDLRALLRHRHQWVGLRVKIQNALQAIALANGLLASTEKNLVAGPTSETRSKSDAHGFGASAFWKKVTTSLLKSR
jgi:hypothetical protein